MQFIVNIRRLPPSLLAVRLEPAIDDCGPSGKTCKLVDGAISPTG